MNTTSLTRSIAYWLLLALSLVSAALGGWLVAGQIGTMTATLLDGTATGIEVYVGQSWIVVGAALLAAGIVGVLLTLGLAAAKALVPSRAVDVIAPADPTAPTDEADSHDDVAVDETAPDDGDGDSEPDAGHAPADPTATDETGPAPANGPALTKESATTR